jgi:hypothetical protein
MYYGIFKMGHVMAIPKNIELAILDYYRAIEKRSRWARKELLFGNELEEYEEKIVDEWERHRLSLEDESDFESATDETLRQLAGQVRQLVYQISYREIWWHPLFVDRISTMINEVESK